jgi:hypothetical protein
VQILAYTLVEGAPQCSVECDEVPDDVVRQKTPTEAAKNKINELLSQRVMQLETEEGRTAGVEHGAVQSKQCR